MLTVNLTVNIISDVSEHMLDDGVFSVLEKIFSKLGLILLFLLTIFGQRMYLRFVKYDFFLQNAVIFTIWVLTCMNYHYTCIMYLKLAALLEVPILHTMAGVSLFTQFIHFLLVHSIIRCSNQLFH